MPHDKVALVTGATSGIGRATAFELARRGLAVVVTARDRAAGEKVVDEIKRTTAGSCADLLVCDLSSLESVRAAAADFRARYEHLRVLVNCAAVFVDRRIVTKDGLELMFATNHLGPFLLTNLLLDRLEAGAPARIVTVTAPSALKPDFDNLQGERRFGATTAFGRTKADNLLFTFALARRLAGKPVTANAFHPGVTRGTGLMRRAPAPMRLLMRLAGPFLRTPERDAVDLAELVTSGEFEGISGKFFHDGRPMRSPLEKEVDIQERLWQESARLTGLGPEGTSGFAD
jgi:NAD(P)-dependent dehydrogenase (short-subunit alcohol dehydrogenase family)